MCGGSFGIGFIFLIFDTDDVWIVLGGHAKVNYEVGWAIGSYDDLIYKNGEMSQMIYLSLQAGR